MFIKLERPLVVLDLETTGVNHRYDRIIEIGAVKVHPDGREEVFERRVNPERPIPPESQGIHGITDEDVEDELPFEALAGELLRFLRGCDICGFGVQRFDVPMLAAEFNRVGVVFPDEGVRVVDAQVIFHKREPRTLSAAVELYCKKPHEDAHSALADVRATMDVLDGQAEYYGDLPPDVDSLAGLCREDDSDNVDREGKLKWSGDEVIIAFGQKSGIPLREMADSEPGYLRWMLKRDFSPEVKSIVQNALGGVFPKRREGTKAT
jgi:DNA polymerase-3 subunit epsilon